MISICYQSRRPRVRQAARAPQGMTARTMPQGKTTAPRRVRKRRRDMPDPSGPAPDDDRSDYARRVVAARCPELSDADLASLVGAPPDPDAIPAAVGEQIMDLLDRMADRLEAVERA